MPLARWIYHVYPWSIYIVYPWIFHVYAQRCQPDLEWISMVYLWIYHVYSMYIGDDGIYMGYTWVIPGMLY